MSVPRSFAPVLALLLAAPLAAAAQNVQPAARLQAQPATLTVTRGEAVPLRVVALDAAGQPTQAERP